MSVGTGPFSKNVIILTTDPKGRFLEGIINDTSKPGTCVEIKPGVGTTAGRMTFQATQTQADGALRAVIVLLEDDLQGFPVGTAYVAGTRCRAYAPAMGEELNCIRLDIAGTADDQAVGDLLEIDNPTGKLIAASSPASAPFQALEAIVDPTSDSLTAVMYTGH